MVHWLVINTFESSEKYLQRAWKDIKNYLDKYKNSNVTLYYRDYSLGDIVLRLECKQNYNDLDLEVNSFSSCIRRIASKPKNISLSRLQADYYINEYVQ